MANTTQAPIAKPVNDGADSSSVSDNAEAKMVPALDQEEPLNTNFRPGDFDPEALTEIEIPVPVALADADRQQQITTDVSVVKIFDSIHTQQTIDIEARLLERPAESMPASAIQTSIVPSNLLLGISAERIEDLAQNGITIVDRMGSGGMGEIFLARSEHYQGTGANGADHLFALKVVNETASDTAKERFGLELHTLAIADHPNLIKPIDVGVFRDGTNFYTMSLMDGGSLFDLYDLTQQNPNLKTRALNSMVEVLDALEHLHTDLGYVHRDIKPENLLFLKQDLRSGETLQLQIADPGIVQLIGSEQGGQQFAYDVPEEVRNLSLTRAGLTVGTPHYMSPEQITNVSTLDGRSDQYAVGVILFELVTGEAPHSGDTTLDIFNARLYGRPPDPRVHVPDLDPALSQVIMKMLAREPENRYQTAKEAAQALKNVLTGIGDNQS